LSDRWFKIEVGIASIQERARLIGGQLDIDSAGQGTTVRATIPLTMEANKLTNLKKFAF